MSNVKRWLALNFVTSAGTVNVTLPFASVVAVPWLIMPPKGENCVLSHHSKSEKLYQPSPA